MEAFADMECCLKVHSNCEACMMKTIDVIRSIRGVYSVMWDAQQSLFRISGEVDPNILLKAVMRTGEHAELVTVKLNHPQLRHRNYNYNYSSSSRSDAYHHQPPLSLGERPRYYDENHRRGPHHSQLATYVPSYPPQQYDAFDNYEGMSVCTIV